MPQGLGRRNPRPPRRSPGSLRRAMPLPTYVFCLPFVTSRSRSGTNSTRTWSRCGRGGRPSARASATAAIIPDPRRFSAETPNIRVNGKPLDPNHTPGARGVHPPREWEQGGSGVPLTWSEQLLCAVQPSARSHAGRGGPGGPCVLRGCEAGEDPERGNLSVLWGQRACLPLLPAEKKPFVSRPFAYLLSNIPSKCRAHPGPASVPPFGKGVLADVTKGKRVAPDSGGP